MASFLRIGLSLATNSRKKLVDRIMKALFLIGVHYMNSLGHRQGERLFFLEFCENKLLAEVSIAFILLLNNNVNLNRKGSLIVLLTGRF